jgi:hypothetical protein
MASHQIASAVLDDVLWIKTAFTVEQLAVKHLADLQEASREIVSSLHIRQRLWLDASQLGVTTWQETRTN